MLWSGRLNVMMGPCSRYRRLLIMSIHVPVHPPAETPVLKSPRRPRTPRKVRASSWDDDVSCAPGASAQASVNDGNSSGCRRQSWNSARPSLFAHAPSPLRRKSHPRLPSISTGRSRWATSSMASTCMPPIFTPTVSMFHWRDISETFLESRSRPASDMAIRTTQPDLPTFLLGPFL